MGSLLYERDAQYWGIPLDDLEQKIMNLARARFTA